MSPGRLIRSQAPQPPAPLHDRAGMLGGRSLLVVWSVLRLLLFGLRSRIRLCAIPAVHRTMVRFERLERVPHFGLNEKRNSGTPETGLCCLRAPHRLVPNQPPRTAHGPSRRQTIWPLISLPEHEPSAKALHVPGCMGCASRSQPASARTSASVAAFKPRVQMCVAGQRADPKPTTRPAKRTTDDVPQPCDAEDCSAWGRETFNMSALACTLGSTARICVASSRVIPVRLMTCATPRSCERKAHKAEQPSSHRGAVLRSRARTSGRLRQRLLVPAVGPLGTRPVQP